MFVIHTNWYAWYLHTEVCVWVCVFVERRGEGAARVNGQVVVICNRKCVCVCVSIVSVGYTFNNKINWL